MSTVKHRLRPQAMMFVGGAIFALAGVGAAHAADDVVTLVDQSATVIDVLANDASLGAKRRLVRVSPPDHGTAVRMPSGLVRYTAPPGFVGSDTFTYHALGEGRTAVQANVTVHVGETLTLQGRVTDSPIAHAQVSVDVGDESYTTQADAAGYYEVEFVRFGGEGMVVASATGGPDQPEVSFQSILGHADRLAEEAGEDRVLQREENNQVQVTNLSTAQSVLVQQASGGAFPENDADLAIAFEAMDLSQVLRMAAAIKLVVDGGMELPEGVTSTLQLVQDQTKVESVLETAGPEAVADTIASIVSDPEVVPPTVPGEIPRSMALVVSARAGTIRRGVGHGQLLELDPDGTGAYLDANGAADPALTWAQREDGTIDVAFEHPRMGVTYPWKDGRQVTAYTTVHGFSLRKMGAQGGVDLVARQQETSYTYPFNPEYPDETFAGTSTLLAYLDGTGEFPYTAGEVVGLRALPYPDAALLYDPKDFGYAVHQFNADGSGSVPSVGRAFTWAISNAGRLEVDHGADGQVSIRRIQTDGRKGEGIVAAATLPGGGRISQAEIAIEVDAGTPSAADFHGLWGSGASLSDPAIPAGSLQGFNVLWRDNGTGVTFSTNADGTFFNVLDYQYTFSDGQLRGEGLYCDSCFDIGFRRHWRLLARDADRIYVVEDLYWYDGGGVTRHYDQRSAFYDLVERPLIPSMQAIEASIVPSEPRGRMLR